MGAEQYLHIVEFAQVVVVDGDKSHLAESFALHTIMYYITEAVERLALCQFFLGLFNGSGHAKAEATSLVNFNL